MNRTKSLKGECQLCGGRLEFPAELVGTPANCPHCGQQTELLLAVAPDESTVPRRALIWAVIGIVILVAGLVAAIVALKRAERWAAQQKHQGTISAAMAGVSNQEEQALAAGIQTTTSNGFAVSAITLEEAPGTAVLYAVGVLKNVTDHKRFGVKLELDLLDGGEQKVGTAADYQQVLEPESNWRFKALVTESKAVSARVASIKEDQ